MLNRQLVWVQVDGMSEDGVAWGFGVGVVEYSNFRNGELVVVTGVVVSIMSHCTII
jgi:hypothetical protein